ncbi:MAG TPA: FHA domain-containing protein [Polyangia bacterium]|nr:FHA domain-containing protein [Polyangia bacterium]
MKRYRLIHQNSNIEAPEGRFDIGRSTECHLVLDDPSVSRLHATIHNEDGRLTVEDRGSRNGVVVNGTRIGGRHELGDGDRISFGQQSIRVVAIGRPADADRTMGLAACQACGAWMSTNDERCGKCGAERGQKPLDPRRTSEIAPITQPGIPSSQAGGSHRTMQPQAMIAGLVMKAIGMEKHQEAERLLGNLMESALKRREAKEAVSDAEIGSIDIALLALAEASKSPKLVSRLFAFHHAMGLLLPRATVEALYELVRKVGYRSCGDMNRYLDFLSTRTAGFSPAEKFVHRRLQGLVGLTS